MPVQWNSFRSRELLALMQKAWTQKYAPLLKKDKHEYRSIVAEKVKGEARLRLSPGKLVEMRDGFSLGN